VDLPLVDKLSITTTNGKCFLKKKDIFLVHLLDMYFYVCFDREGQQADSLLRDKR